MTPPLLPLPHDWGDAVERTRTWTTRVLAAGDGTERRLASASRPQTALRYQGATLTPDAAQQLAAALALAATAPGPARGLVRVPRWEDQLRLAAPAAVGDAALVLLAAPGPDGAPDDARWRAFADAGEVALWVDGRPLRAVPLAPVGAVAAAALTLAAPLAAADCALADGTPRAWPAGTAVVPVARARVAPDLAGAQRTGTVHTAALEVVLEPDAPLAGGAPWLPGDPGTAQAPRVATLAVIDEQGTSGGGGGEGPGYLGPGGQRRLRAVCRDALGAVVPAPVPLAWAVADPDAVRLTVPPGDGASAVAECLVGGGALLFATAVTATLPAAAAVGGVALVGTYAVSWS